MTLWVSLCAGTEPVLASVGSRQSGRQISATAKARTPKPQNRPTAAQRARDETGIRTVDTTISRDAEVGWQKLEESCKAAGRWGADRARGRSIPVVAGVAGRLRTWLDHHVLFASFTKATVQTAACAGEASVGRDDDREWLRCCC